jgi:predicted LPLAT superfamily acyltransferase
MHIVRAKTSFDCSRKERSARVAALVQEYVGTLEKHCLRHPYQWYNFYNFWRKNF